MKYGFYARKMENGLIGIVTTGLEPKHPELTMISNEEHLGDDVNFLMNIIYDVMNHNKKFCDHYLIMDTEDGHPEIKAFIIYEPKNDKRYRLVIIRRNFYNISIKEPIPF